MTEKKDLLDLVIKMVKVSPITIEDAAKLIVAIHNGHEMPDILNNIKEFEENITREIQHRKERYNKGCEDGMSGTEKEYGVGDPDYQAGYSFGCHVRTRDND